MIRVTVELVPYGVESARRTIGTMVIGNDATGTAEYGNYDIRVASEHQSGQHWGGRITNWPRTAYGVWSLVHEALKATVGRFPHVP